MTVSTIVTRAPTIRVTVGTCEIFDIKNDESFQNGISEASTTRTS